MDGYQALQDGQDPDEDLAPLLHLTGISSEEALAPLIVEGEINTEDKVLNIG